MDPEEETETPDVETLAEDNGTTIIVNEDGGEPEPIAVIVEASDNDSDAVAAVVVAETIDQAERIARLEAENEELRAAVSHATFTAEIAENTAEFALEVADNAEEADEEILEAVDETLDEVIDEVNDGKDSDEDEIIPDDIAPASSRVHPLFRSFSDWKNK